MILSPQREWQGTGTGEHSIDASQRGQGCKPLKGLVRLGLPVVEAKGEKGVHLPWVPLPHSSAGF